MDNLDHLALELRLQPETPSQEFVPRQTKSHTEFRYLARDVFSHMRAVFSNTGLDQVRMSKLAKCFYNSYYSPPPLQDYDTRTPINPDELILQLLKNLTDGKRNHISFLTGKVGTGKTAFVNYLITDVFPRLWLNNKFWFIRFDLEDDGGWQIFTSEESLMSRFCRKLARILRENKFWPADDQSILDKIAELDGKAIILARKIQNDKDNKAENRGAIGTAKALSDCEECLKSLINLIQEKTSRKPIIIFDNIDYLFHIHDRSICRPDNDTTNDIIRLDDLRRFVSQFDRTGILRDLNALILIVARTDSYDIIKKAAFSIAAEEMSCWILSPPKWRQILDARLNLLEWAVDNIKSDGKKEQFTEIARIIREDANRSHRDETPLIERLTKLANCGFRQVVDFLSMYPFIGHNADTEAQETIDRFLHHAPVAQIAFCLNRKCIFSQSESKFPNIYLIHRPSSEIDDSSPINSESNYRHTYWLKRLLLECIKQKPNWLPSKLRAIFSAEGGYDDFIVRECLGSLNEVQSSWLISAERERHPDPAVKQLRISRLQLTDRAAYCLDEKVSFFDRFHYLQLVVDDYLLPLPKSVLHHFAYAKNHGYSYIIGTSDEYKRRASDMIRIKAKQVVVFLECLHAFWDIEQIRFKGAFDRLRGEKVKLPDIRHIKQSVWLEIERINDHYDKNLLGELIYLRNLASEARASIEKDLGIYLEKHDPFEDVGSIR